jgi:multiple sugar transport system ATP-binding protein
LNKRLAAFMAASGVVMARVLFDHISKRFGQVVALEDFCLEVMDREFLVLLGPSGCGKTTALRIVAGLEDPTSGTVVIGDRIVNNVEAKNRDVAMVFQNYALYPHMTVYDNLAFPLRMRKVPRHERDRAVREVAEILGLSALLKRKPAELSGGQRQRVALGRAIVRQPQVFLMDEPLSNLDAKLRIQMRAELVASHRQLQRTIIYVTHDQVEAMTMGSRIAILKDGVLQQVGPPQAVYDRPANTFVAQFIGSPAMNLFETTVHSQDGRLCADAPGVHFELDGSVAAAVRAAGVDRVSIGVRPEHLILNREGEVHASVFAVESLGHEKHVVCVLPDGNRITVRTSADVTTTGDVTLAVDPRQVHLFNGATGERIG